MMEIGDITQKSSFRCISMKDSSRKGVRVKFYRNGDVFFKGFDFNFCHHNYQNMDYLLGELNRSVLCDQTVLPYGIRCIFTLSGKKIKNVDYLYDGHSYVVSSSNHFIPLPYEQLEYNSKWRILPTLHKNSSSPQNQELSPSQLFLNEKRRKKFNECLSNNVDSSHGKLIYIVRNNIGRPREILCWLLNGKTGPNIEKVLNDLSLFLAMERGRLKYLVAADGTVITSMSKLYEKSNKVLFAFGVESYKKEDLKLSVEEKEILLKVINQKSARLTSIKNFSMNEELIKTKVEQFIPSHMDVSNKVLFSTEFSILRRCYDHKRHVEGFVKIIDFRKFTPLEKSLMEQEIIVMKSVKHVNIMTTSAYYSNDLFHVLVLEKVPESSLMETVIKSSHHSERFIASVANCLTSALDYLHGHKIVVRHLTVDNIMVSKCNDKLEMLKICDLSLATKIKVRNVLFEICGSPYYIAPEILLESGYDIKVDMWSLGIILFILFHGQPPHLTSCKSHNEIFFKIVTERVDFNTRNWKHVTEEAKSLVKFLLSKNPVMRFNSAAVLKHSWIKHRLTKTPDFDIRPFIDQNLQTFLTTQKGYTLVDAHPLVCTRLDNECLFFVSETKGDETDGGDGMGDGETIKKDDSD